MQHKPKQGRKTGSVADASNLITVEPASTAKPLRVVDIMPAEQSLVLLGEFEQEARLKGYSLELTPHPRPETSVVSQVTRVEEGATYKLYLYIANFGRKPIHAVVRQM